MTINELLSLAGLTVSDEIPVWDAEGQVNGRTKKITAQNLAASIKTIASLIASSDLDATPTSGSTKAVQSGGVYNAIQQSTANFQPPTSSAADLNDCIAPGFYRAGSATLNRPETGSRYYAVFVMPFGPSDVGQIAIEVNLNKMHVRSLEGGVGWKAWKTVTLT